MHTPETPRRAVTSGTVLSVLFVLFGVLAIAACNGSDGTPTTGSTPDSVQSSASFDGETIEVSPTRVSDGDSLRATGPDGELEIRLLGINTPEVDECLGDEARARLEELVLESDVVELGPWPAATDGFGRTLAFVIADGVVVNLALVESGHAVAHAQSDHPLVEEFESAEREAAAAGRGIWAADACGEPSTAEFAIVDAMEDAPGNDRENPNGEWVLIRNEGDEPAELDGWSLRDESTRHRFDFPPLVVEPDESVRVRTGCGENDLDADPIELFWCDPEPPVWNNDGDTAFLLDQNGGNADYFRIG